MSLLWRFSSRVTEVFRLVDSCGASHWHHPQSLSLRWKHHRTVRVIVTTDHLPQQGHKNDVIHVRPGYARNYLIPRKMAKYATRQNLAHFGLVDPDLSGEEEEEDAERTYQRRRSSQVDAGDSSDTNLRAADLLKKYLSSKVLTIWRKVNDDVDMVPIDRKGVCDKNIRSKLSKQLKIDLEKHERIVIRDEVLPSLEEFSRLGSEEKIDALLRDMGPYEQECQEVRHLGYYLCRIWLAGDHLVPLKLHVARKP